MSSPLTDKLAVGAKLLDSIVIAVHGDGEDNSPENTAHARAANTAITVLSSLDSAPYVIQVGGASTVHNTKEKMQANLHLPVAEGSPFWAMLFGHLVALDAYRASDVDWTIITPPFDILGWTPQGITDTKRTGNYRTSTTQHVTDAEGNSAIYVADLAVATIDELENRVFNRQRFFVGY